jgi:hypothetical protein
MTSFEHGVIVGVASFALVVVLIVIIKAITMVGTVKIPTMRYRVRLSRWTLNHQVGSAPQDEHQHTYSVWIPYRIARRLLARDAKRCVFTHLGMTAGAVWDAEVRFVAQQEFDVNIDADGSRIDEVGASIRETYSIAYRNIDWVIRYESDKITPIAEAQLLRSLSDPHDEVDEPDSRKEYPGFGKMVGYWIVFGAMVVAILGFGKMVGYWLVFYAMVVIIFGIIAAVVIAIMGRKVSP